MFVISKGVEEGICVRYAEMKAYILKLVRNRPFDTHFENHKRKSEWMFSYLGFRIHNFQDHIDFVNRNKLTRYLC